MQWDDARSPPELEEAFETRDPAKVERVLDALGADLARTRRRVPIETAKAVLGTLRRYARFDKLRMLAAQLDAYAQDDPHVLLHLAQARIELGEITKAVEALLRLEAYIEDALRGEGLSSDQRNALEQEWSETLGLLGRAYKQYYINAQPAAAEPRTHDVQKSLAYYRRARQSRRGDTTWHAINEAALLTHQTRIAQNKRNATSPEAMERAEEILDALHHKKGPLDVWELASRIEACLAIGDTAEAVRATQAYLDRADAFAVQSTQRQLVELWMLTEAEPPGSEILPLMSARHAELGGTVDAVELHPDKAALYEKVWGTTRYRSLQWIREALRRANSVARIGPNKYEGVGTGFLFDGAWIADTWADRHLLLTNAHVCSDDPGIRRQFPYLPGPHDLTAAFLGEGGAREAAELRFERVVWTSAPAELDATLLALASPPEGRHPPPLTNRNPPVSMTGDTRLNILGHPRGLELRISLQDNETVAVSDRFVHYRTPTDPGSSGSPVFNQNWELVALHHASSAVHRANEGVRMDAIIDAIRKSVL